MHQRNVEFKFCPVCGGKLESRRIKTNEPIREVCSKCGYVFYLDPKVVACAIFERDSKIVLLKRGIDPQKGKWVIPGGYVDRGEVVETAAIRETEEECGITIQINRLLGIYSYPGYIPVVIVFLAEYLSGNLTPRDETIESTWFSKSMIPWEDLAFQSTADALKDYCRISG